MHEIDGLRYELRGDGEPVLLIHGALIADGFLPFMSEPALIDVFRLVRYQRRGFAGSSRRSGEVADQALDAQSLLAQAETQDQVARIDVWRALLAQAAASGTLAEFISRATGPAGPP